MGGEKPLGKVQQCVLLGSPPHGRGKEHAAPAGHTAAGITPAWAGKSRRAGRCAAASGDHPRVGGEKSRVSVTACALLGSPPHGRGKGKFNIAFIVSDGITPALAGKRADGAGGRETVGDHPRVGGEKHAAPVSWMWSAGSPPRGRGKGPPVSGFYIWLGITPAWAGKSLSPCTT